MGVQIGRKPTSSLIICVRNIVTCNRLLAGYHTNPGHGVASSCWRLVYCQYLNLSPSDPGGLVRAKKSAFYTKTPCQDQGKLGCPGAPPIGRSERFKPSTGALQAIPHPARPVRDDPAPECPRVQCSLQSSSHSDIRLTRFSHAGRMIVGKSHRSRV